jgi:hypothetical protein
MFIFVYVRIIYFFFLLSFSVSSQCAGSEVKPLTDPAHWLETEKESKKKKKLYFLHVAEYDQQKIFNLV